ncbi:hypothetical protein ACYOEI_00755 [Singulisphaera rosea]
MGLQYNVAYHLRCQITLQSGRTITLEALDQEMSYAGLLEGTPDAKTNDWYIESSLRVAARRCVPGARPHLIPPSRRDYLREPGDMRPIVEHSPHRTPEWLPMVRCIGVFKDVGTARDPDRDLSVLVIVWFQDEYALPIQEPALDQLLALDWDSRAFDVDL